MISPPCITAQAQRHPRVSEYADRAGRVGDRRGRLCGIHQPGRCEHGHGAFEIEPQQHGGLAEVTARLQQVRSEPPAEAEPPVVEVQRADRPYASFYLSFTSSERTVPAVTDWLRRTLQPQLVTLSGVQRVTIEGGRQIAMRIWIDPDRLASFNLSPGDVQGALRRNNYLAAVGRTKGNLVQVNLLANPDLRSLKSSKT